MTNHRQTRSERRADLDEQIAFRKQRIADDTAALHDLLRRSGRLEAAALTASILEDGSLESFWLQGGDDESAVSPSQHGSIPSNRASPKREAIGDDYAPKLIDGASLAKFADELVDYKRKTVLEMIRVLEQNHPTPVKATDVNNRIIDELSLCPKPTFSKLKKEIRKSGLISYNGSNKTWSIPSG